MKLNKSFKFNFGFKSKKNNDIEEKNNLTSKFSVVIDELMKIDVPVLKNEYANDYFKIIGLHFPSKKLSGELFDFHWLDKENFAFYIIDVINEGKDNASYSISIANLIKYQSLVNTDYTDAGQVLTGLNNFMLLNSDERKYIKVWYGVFNTSSNLVRFASTERCSALSFGSNDEIKIHEFEKNFIETSERYEFMSCKFELNDQTKLYVVSDGVFSIKKSNGSYFKINDIADFFSLYSNEKETDIMDFVNHLKLMQGKITLDDDITFEKLLFKKRRKSYSAVNPKINRIIGGNDH